MVTLKTEILEKSQHGDFQLTEKGEFLSYYDAHLKLFEEILKSKKLAKEKETESLNGVKTYMEKNTTKTDHFFEQMDSFSAYLNVSKEELGEYLTAKFISALEESQKKIKNQELDRLESGDAFKSILDEVLFKVGEVFPQNSVFTIKEELLVIHDKTKNVFIKPVGLLVEVKAEQEKLKEKIEADKLEKEKSKATEKKVPEPTLPKETKDTPAPIAVFIPETSILLDILEIQGMQFPKKKLEITDSSEDDVPEPKQSSSPIDLSTEIEPESEPVSDPDPEPESTPEGPFSFSTREESEVQEESPNVENYGSSEDESFMEGELDLGMDESGPVVEELDGSYEEPIDTEDSNESIIESQDESGEYKSPIEEELGIEEEAEPIQRIEKKSPTLAAPTKAVNTKPFQIFNYLHYLTIQRSIEKIKDDPIEYKKFLNASSVVTKSFVSIQVNISKELQYGSMDWDSYYANLQRQTGVEISFLMDFKLRIQKLNLTKKSLDIIVAELKKQPESVTKILKSGWPHIVDAFGDAPDFDSVKEKVQVVLERIKNPEIRQPIDSIIQKALKNLVIHCDNLSS